ncbi:MAG TPA: VWA domain-containing protein [Granulicella sp.]
MHALRFALAAGAFSLLVLPACAQHPTLKTPQDEAPAQTAKPTESKPADAKPQTLSVTANLVNLPVVVRDNKGALVPGLKASDFTLQVDGHAQAIRYFDVDHDLPLTVGLLVDTSESQRSAIDDERTASSAFLDEMLTGKNQAFLIQFARSVELLEDVTSSRPKLQAGLKDLDTPAPNDHSYADNSEDDSNDRNNNGRRGNGGGDRARGATALYDATFLASDEILSHQKGRRAIILLTGGVDRNSKERLTDAIESAQRSDTVLYAIYFKGEEQRQDYGNRGGGYPGGRGGIGFPGGYPGGGYPGRGGPSRQPEQRPDGKKILERMTKETGGRMFEVSKHQPVGDIYKQIAEELRAQYRLDFTPDPLSAGDGYHQVDLAPAGSDKKKYSIQTRDGYYGRP